MVAGLGAATHLRASRDDLVLVTGDKLLLQVGQLQGVSYLRQILWWNCSGEAWRRCGVNAKFQDRVPGEPDVTAPTRGDLQHCRHPAL